MNLTAIKNTFEQLGVILADGHFLYASGRHGNAYVNKDALYPHTSAIRDLCKTMIAPFTHEPIDVVAGPTIGGVILTQWCAHFLSEASGREVLACYAEERTNAAGEKERYFGRGYDALVRGKRVLVVEDILNTGGSIHKVIAALRVLDATIVGVRALCNRGNVTPADIGNTPLSALLDLTLESWNPAECPLCKQGIPIDTRVGKGAKSQLSSDIKLTIS